MVQSMVWLEDTSPLYRPSFHHPYGRASLRWPYYYITIILYLYFMVQGCAPHTVLHKFGVYVPPHAGWLSFSEWYKERPIKSCLLFTYHCLLCQTSIASTVQNPYLRFRVLIFMQVAFHLPALLLSPQYQHLYRRDCYFVLNVSNRLKGLQAPFFCAWN